jgi:LysR family transcriptional regulator (chromosome initiation inhibitor)
MHTLNAAQLAAFAEIVRTGSFEGAARKLHVTPSAISQRVKQLEDRLGQVMLVRESPCRPTRAGQELLKYAAQVELLENELFHKLGMSPASPAQPLSVPISVNADSLDGWFLDAFEETCKNSRVMLDVRVEDQGHSAQLLRDGEVMAAIAASPAAPQGCSAEFLGRMRYLALCSPEFHERYFREGVSERTFLQAPMLIYNAKDDMQQAFVELLTSRPLQAPSHYIPSTNSFVYLAQRGLGWGMIPEHMVTDSLASGELVEVLPGKHIDVDLYFHRWQIQSPALDVLSVAIRAAARQGLRAAH